MNPPRPYPLVILVGVLTLIGVLGLILEARQSAPLDAADAGPAEAAKAMSETKP